MRQAMDPEQIRRWSDARRAGAKREEEEMLRATVDRPTAIRLALDLISVFENMHGWPVPEDAVTRRENERAREQWARLRAAWRAR